MWIILIYCQFYLRQNTFFFAFRIQFGQLMTYIGKLCPAVDEDKRVRG